MLTVDSQAPGDLSERDADMLRVLAGLVAIAKKAEQLGDSLLDSTKRYATRNTLDLMANDPATYFTEARRSARVCGERS
jgi:hypothetical protein